MGRGYLGGTGAAVAGRGQGGFDLGPAGGEGGQRIVGEAGYIGLTVDRGSPLEAEPFGELSP
ncbi:MAG: hypothetical protein M0Z30_09100 [Actinomycetota bacterium]|nr:hypothetical protein [Actinomycetota bacterium]